MEDIWERHFFSVIKINKIPNWFVWLWPTNGFSSLINYYHATATVRIDDGAFKLERQTTRDASHRDSMRSFKRCAYPPHSVAHLKFSCYNNTIIRRMNWSNNKQTKLKLSTWSLYACICACIMSVNSDISCLCLGPKQSGKTHLLTSLQTTGSVTNVSHSVPTIGTNIFRIKLPEKLSTVKLNVVPVAAASNNAATAVTDKPRKSIAPRLKEITILEIGGSMAPMWTNYLSNISKILYVVDTSNLCQISAAGDIYTYFMSTPKTQKQNKNRNTSHKIRCSCESHTGVLLYTFLADPRLQHTKVLLVLTKMDLAYRQMRNEALLMLQFTKLKKQIRQPITIVETSAITCNGNDKILDWLSIPWFSSCNIDDWWTDVASTYIVHALLLRTTNDNNPIKMYEQTENILK